MMEDVPKEFEEWRWMGLSMGGVDLRNDELKEEMTLSRRRV